MNLPAIRNAGDVDKAAEKVTQAIRRGDLTPAEGGILMNILESRSRVSREYRWKAVSRNWKRRWPRTSCVLRPEAGTGEAARRMLREQTCGNCAIDLEEV